MSKPLSHAPLYLSVALVSAAALAYEVLLTRLLAIVHWHHFAYLVISLALLGFGASGAVLSLCGDWCARRFRACYVANAVLFGAGAPLCFALAQALPFNALEVTWSSHQWGWLALLFLCLAIPFFGAASCIALAFLRYRERIAAVYAADLAGAGLGAGAVILWLYFAPPEGVLQGLSALGLAAAMPVGWGGGRGLRVASGGLALAAAAPRALATAGGARSLAVQGALPGPPGGRRARGRNPDQPARGCSPRSRTNASPSVMRRV